MAVEVEIDVELLKSEIKKTYASVSEQPDAEFIFPTGRAWAKDLDYPDELANVPEAAVESFAARTSRASARPTLLQPSPSPPGSSRRPRSATRNPRPAPPRTRPAHPYNPLQARAPRSSARAAQTPTVR